MDSQKIREAEASIHHANGGLNYHLELFGYELAKRHEYVEHKGIDAVRYFLMQKHGWLPRDVKSMSFEDLHFAIAEDRSGWKPDRQDALAYPS